MQGNPGWTNMTAEGRRQRKVMSRFVLRKGLLLSIQSMIEGLHDLLKGKYEGYSESNLFLF
jgi:hypothetical protein